MNQNASVIQPFAQYQARPILKFTAAARTREHGANCAIVTVDSSPVDEVRRGHATQQYAYLFHLLSQHALELAAVLRTLK